MDRTRRLRAVLRPIAAAFTAVPHGHRRREYWSWAAGALYILLTLDLLTTMYAAAMYGARAEVNPLIRWGLEQGVATLVAMNLVALVLLSVLFYGIIELTIHAPERHRPVVALSFEVWLALVIAAGLVVFANNLTIIVHGENLSLGALHGLGRLLPTTDGEIAGYITD